MYLPVEDNRDYDKSVMSLKNELNDVKNEVRRMYQGNQPDSRLEKMVQKLLDQRRDFEDDLEDKDKLIKKLRKELEESNLNLNELKESLKLLVKNNRELEIIVRRLLEEKNETQVKYDYVTIDLTRDNSSLKTQN